MINGIITVAIMNFFRFFILFLLFFQLQARAGDLQVKFQDWGFYKTNRGDKTLCYVMSSPIKSIGDNKKPRGDSFFIVTNIENGADEVSISSGINYHETSDVELSFGVKKFNLLSDKARAWSYDKDYDIDIIKQMQQSADVIVSAISVINENVSDTYSLIGFVDAYKEMKKTCKNN
jgi:hypothetical protein